MKLILRILFCLQLPITLSAGTVAMIRATGTSQAETEESPTQSGSTLSEILSATSQRRDDESAPRQNSKTVRETARASSCPRRRSLSDYPKRSRAGDGHRLANGLVAPMLT